jgi:hypothetical protein
MAKRLNRDNPDKVEKALKDLLESKSVAEPSLLEQVTTHLALIEKLRERGHSFGRIAEALRQVGVHVAENTLRLYVGRLRRKADATGAFKPNRVARVASGKQSDTSADPLKNHRGDTPHAKRKFEAGEAWLTAQPDENEI